MRCRLLQTFLCEVLLAVGVGPVSGATVAYWRFEAGPAGAAVPHSGAAGAFDGTIPDVSGNGNDLSAWSQAGFAGFEYRADVPAGTVPQSGRTNRFSVKNTGSYPAMFTSSAGSAPSGIVADTLTPAQFTIEASYKPEMNGNHRTVVGRDARSVATAGGDLAALYLKINPDDSVGIQFTDVSGYTHSAFSPPGWMYGFDYPSNPQGVGAPWYHLAAVSDGASLSMFVDNVLVASTDLAGSGSPNTALVRGTVNGTEWATGAWSVGRGLYAGGHTDRAFGFIDEVRISDTALTPAEFLFAPRPCIQSVQSAGGPLSFTIAGTRPGASCSLLYSPDPTLPLDQWGVLPLRTTITGTSFSFSTSIAGPGLQNFFALKTDFPAPPAGLMTYSLAGDWPADARERIIYAMEGAVAQYNRYGAFNKHVWANYSPGTPTADGSYSGWINFGSNPAYQNYRTALHEISHTLGAGTIDQWYSRFNGGVWTGPQGVQQIREFDGPGGVIHESGVHFWPYGLNYDSEGNTENFRRHVLMMAAFRKDMGIQ